MRQQARRSLLSNPPRANGGTIVPAPIPSRIAVIVDWRPQPPSSRPADTPLGWLARDIAREGVELVFCPPSAVRQLPHGDGMSAAGYVVDGGHWREVNPQPVSAAYCRRVPRWELEQIAQLAQQFQRCGLPFANPMPLVRLCRDKLEWHAALTRACGPTPETVASPRDMFRSLFQWKRGFLKPRFGALGIGVWRLRCEESRVLAESADDRQDLSPDGFSALLESLEQAEPHILQREIVLPVMPWTGFSIRSLIQRRADLRWTSALPVARLSRFSVVSNVARGAEARPLADLRVEPDGVDGAALCRNVEKLDHAIAAIIDTALGQWAPLAVEVGIDYALDHDGTLWCLEGNDTPRGRLAAVAAGNPQLVRRFRASLRRPIRYLARPATAVANVCRLLRDAEEPAAFAQGLPVASEAIRSVRREPRIPLR